MRKAVLILLIAGLIFGGFALGKTKLIFPVHWSDFQVEGIKNEAGNLQVKGLRQYVDEYMALNPDVEIEIQSVPFDEYLKRILISHTAGQISDIYVLYSLWAVQLVDSAILDSPSKALVDTMKKDFVQTAIDGTTIDGDLWGIPFEVDNYALLYNKKLFAEAGIENPPATWDELLEIAPKLTKKAADGTTDVYGFAYLSGWDSAVVHPYLALVYSLGGKMFKDDFSESLLTSPETVQALKAELELFKNGSTDTAASAFGFATGKSAMTIMAPWYESNVKIGFKDDYEEVVGVAPVPTLKNPASVGYTWFVGVDAMSKNKKEAWKFLEWFTLDKLPGGGTRMGEFMAKNIGAIPPKKSDIEAYPGELNDPYTSVFVQELKNTYQEPNVAQGQEIKTILMREIVEAWNGRKTAEKALADAKKQIDEILEEFY